MRTFAPQQQPAQHTKPASSMRPGLALSRQGRAASFIRSLQRSIGNRAVARLAQAQAKEPEGGRRTTASPGLGRDLVPIPASVREVLRSSGQPLDPAIREFMEPRFGYDFADVRIHTDTRAAEAAAALNARAFTFWGEIVFGAGQYRPDTGTGRRLLAHELTHVV